MNREGEAPFVPMAIPITVIFIGLTIFACSAVSLGTSYDWTGWTIPAALVVAVIGMRFIAPGIPKSQLIYLLAAIVAVVVLGDFFAHQGSVVLSLVIGQTVPFICVFGFGAFWVRRGYIPPWSNRW